jgi:serine O-acetyltransferase
MNMKQKIRYIWNKYFDYDGVGERKILKSIELFHRGGPLDNLNKLRAFLMWNHIRKIYNCNVYPGVTIGKNLHIVHSSWVAIGKTAEIGDNCRIFSRVDLTAKVVGDDYTSKVRRHPKIGNDCILGNGCMLIGAITVGDDCIIGARAVVTKNVPPHSVVIGTNQIRPKRPEEIEKPYRHEFGLD